MQAGVLYPGSILLRGSRVLLSWGDNLCVGMQNTSTQIESFSLVACNKWRFRRFTSLKGMSVRNNLRTFSFVWNLSQHIVSYKKPNLSRALPTHCIEEQTKFGIHDKYLEMHSFTIIHKQMHIHFVFVNRSIIVKNAIIILWRKHILIHVYGNKKVKEQFNHWKPRGSLFIICIKPSLRIRSWCRNVRVREPDH